MLATGFTWAVTAVGASVVFFTKEISQRILDAMLGFAAGIMIAAAIGRCCPPPSGWLRMVPYSPDLATMAVLLGFTTMMILDVALG